MNSSLRLALAQRHFWVGDIAGNSRRIVEDIRRARDELQAQLVVFPELALVGYPPDDLLLRTAMPAAVAEALAAIAAEVQGIDVVLGHPSYGGGLCRNSASLLRDGRVALTTHKQALPNYGVFDERRHFTPGDGTLCFHSGGRRIGLLICEDLWEAAPARQARASGAELLLSINASPYSVGKTRQRHDIAVARAAEAGLPVIYANLVGGQDDLLFDGASFAIAADGRTVMRAPSFHEALVTVTLAADGTVSGECCAEEEDSAVLYRGLVQSVRDYVDRNGFPGALIGLSGGIDSALVAALAVDALGPDRVQTVAMPSRYTADMSNDDAAEQARRMGVQHRVIPVEPAFVAYSGMLAEPFAGREVDVTEENLQSRIRGTLLMALSNKFGHVVLTTGNKSEMAVGYATLYGDMCGGFAPLKDVYKGDVWRLARWRNREQELIPTRVIERPPSAELRPEQTDEDSLPPYQTLDEIVRLYVEEQRSTADIAARGHDAEVVRRVAQLIRRSEYKRRQAPPGPKVTPVAFGRDRRFPITASYDTL